MMELLLFLSSDIIANLDYNYSSFPFHDYVADKNKDIEVSNMTLYNKTVIKNAYCTVLGVLPSVEYNDTIYINNTSDPLLASSADIELINSTTCSEKYNLIENTSTTKIEVTSEDLSKTFVASCLFNVKYYVFHYKLKTYCCLYKNNVCAKYCSICSLESTEQAEESLVLNDSINTMLYNNTFQDSIIVNSSKEYFENLVFSYEVKVNPYNFLQIVSKNANTRKIYGTLYDNGLIHLKDIENCTLTRINFFTKSVNGCSSNKKEDYAKQDKRLILFLVCIIAFAIIHI